MLELSAFRATDSLPGRSLSMINIRKTNFRSRLALFTFLCCLVGCSDTSEKQNPAASGPGGGAEKAIDVRYTEMRMSEIRRTNQLPGRVVAYQMAEIRPQVSGIILERMFEEGTYVEEGQQLYQIDPALFKAELNIAEANLTNAEARLSNATARYERFERLQKSGAVSEQQYEDALAELNQSRAAKHLAEAEVSSAQINLDYTEVRSPISGYIGPSAVTRGALVTALQDFALATVRQLDPVYVDLSQTAVEARRLEERLMRARASGEGEKTYEVSLFLGTTDEIYPEKGVLDATDLSVDPQTGAIRLRAIVTNPDRMLLPGLFVRASIEEVGGTRGLLVPQKSVVIEPDGEKTVWVVAEGDVAQKRIIQVGAAYENQWIVMDGLETGDLVIVEGRMNLREGSPVNAEPLGRREGGASVTQNSGG